MKKITIITSIIFCTTLSFGFNLGSFTESIMEKVTNSSESSSKSLNLSNSTISSGLKAALEIGVDYAVKSLGAKNGYFNNSLVKIPLPENLQKIESLIRKAGGDKIADDLILSMNTAASKAAPKTARIFIDAIEKMNLEDAKKILNGGDHAATEYFKENTTNNLKKMITPIIQESMKENSVAGYYDTFNTYYKKYGKGVIENSGIMGLAKNYGVDSYLPSASNENLDDYVTTKAIDGLFKMIASKEISIRNNPVEQTTSLLKKVFGK